MLKVTNLGKSVRRLIDGPKWVYLKPKESVVLERIDSSQDFIKDSKIFKIEEVNSDGKKVKKGED